MSSGRPVGSQPAQRSGPGLPRPTAASRTESSALALGLGGAVVGLAVGLLALDGTAPLSGDRSIGQVAAAAEGTETAEAPAEPARADAAPTTP